MAAPQANAVTTRPTEAEIWAWLDTVPDPEIPVISVVDLGIVRAVRWEQDELVVVVTPTYSGCPAIQTINEDIAKAIQSRGIEHVRIERQLSPAWTTDWLSERGRKQLRGYGIAPPEKSANGPDRQVIDISQITRRAGMPATPACPLCESDKTTLVSRFGSTPCKAHYRCLACLEPFDHFKEI